MVEMIQLCAQFAKLSISILFSFGKAMDQYCFVKRQLPMLLKTAFPTIFWNCVKFVNLKKKLTNTHSAQSNKYLLK